MNIYKLIYTYIHAFIHTYKNIHLLTFYSILLCTSCRMYLAHHFWWQASLSTKPSWEHLNIHFIWMHSESTQPIHILNIYIFKLVFVSWFDRPLAVHKELSPIDISCMNTYKLRRVHLIQFDRWEDPVLPFKFSLLYIINDTTKLQSCTTCIQVLKCRDPFLHVQNFYYFLIIKGQLDHVSQFTYFGGPSGSIDLTTWKIWLRFPWDILDVGSEHWSLEAQLTRLSAVNIWVTFISISKWI